VVLFDPYGQVRWISPGHTYLSPKITENSRIILASHLGGLLAITTSGLPIASIQFLEQRNGKAALFLTVAAALQHNRVYALTGYQDNETRQNFGILYSVDVRATVTQRLNITWKYPFEEVPSGHPLIIQDNRNDIAYVVISSETTIYGIQDNGFSYHISWTQPSPFSSPTSLSMVKDPTSQLFWLYARDTSSTLYQMDVINGTILKSFNISELMCEENETCFISSYVNIAGPEHQPIMIFTVKVAQSDDLEDSYSNFLVGFDLNKEKIIWQYELGMVPVAGQFPVLNDGNQDVVIFSTVQDGIWAIGSSASKSGL